MVLPRRRQKRLDPGAAVPTMVLGMEAAHLSEHALGPGRAVGEGSPRRLSEADAR